MQISDNSMDNTKARLISFFLPQFHPIPENDLWWGKGFTEWTNVVKAQPLFKGHYQPHIPADLGFYDLRCPETREAQAALAREYSIEGFCYWHYWFGGKRLLERPFNDVLHSGKPDFPFCLAWANEPWSRRWTGEEKEILQAQIHSEEDDRNHIEWLLQVFADPRNIRVDGRPLFLIYRPRHLPNPQKTTDLFRNKCAEAGLPEPFLLGIDSHCPGFDCRRIGFDGTVKFEPQLGDLPDFATEGFIKERLRRNSKLGVNNGNLKLYDYEQARALMMRNQPGHPVYPSIMVGWDNTPRRGEQGVIITGATPEKFGTGLADFVDASLTKPYQDRLIFINAWNEWAEGNHLEPDQRFGRAFLEKIKEINSASVTTTAQDQTAPTPGSLPKQRPVLNAGSNIKKRILFVSHSAGLHGAERCLLTLAKNLNKEKFTPVICLPDKGRLQKEAESLGIQTIIFPLERWIVFPHEYGSSGQNLLERASKLAEIIKEEKIDIVHTNTALIAEGALAALMTNCPHIWHMHEILAGHPSLIVPLPLYLTYKLIDIYSEYVVCVSMAVKNSLSDFIRTEKLEVIYNGIEMPREPLSTHKLRRELGLKDSTLLVCTIGDIIEEKGYSTFVSAAIQALKKNKDIHFISVGDFGDQALYRRLKEQIREGAMDAHISFLGYRSDIWQILYDIDVYVTPSQTESFSLAIVEAMASGKPVISTRCGGPEEIIINGSTGRLVPVNDPDTMADAIIDLASDQAKRHEMGANGRIRFEENFTVSRYVSAFEDLYSSSIGKALLPVSDDRLAGALVELLSANKALKGKDPREARIEEMLNSYSWKITAPVRWIYEKIFLRR